MLEEGRLDQWTRSCGESDTKSFYYRRGKGIDIPLAGGGSRGERIEVKASGGWGTYFVPEARAAYTLTVTILNAESTLRRPTRLVLEGGGWK